MTLGVCIFMSFCPYLVPIGGVCVAHLCSKGWKSAPRRESFALTVCLTIVSKKGTNPILRQAK